MLEPVKISSTGPIFFKTLISFLSISVSSQNSLIAHIRSDSFGTLLPFGNPHSDSVLVVKMLAIRDFKLNIAPSLFFVPFMNGNRFGWCIITTAERID